MAVSLGGFGRLDNLQGFGRLDHCGANVLLTESVNRMPCKRALATDLIVASHACKQPLLQRAASAPEMPVPSDKVLICTRNLAPDIRGTIHALLPACAPHHKCFAPPVPHTTRAPHYLCTALPVLGTTFALNATVSYSTFLYIHFYVSPHHITSHRSASHCITPHHIISQHMASHHTSSYCIASTP